MHLKPRKSSLSLALLRSVSGFEPSEQMLLCTFSSLCIITAHNQWWLDRNYKESSFKKDLQEAAPDFVDCYFDLVGGDILDACIPLVKPYGRIVACGAITGYNDTSKHVIKNWTEVITNSLTIQGELTMDIEKICECAQSPCLGFVVLHFMHRIQEALDFISLALKEGKLKIEETVVRASIEELPMIWMRLFSGENSGKLISQVADL